MKAAYLFLALSAIASHLARPFLVGFAGPLPWGEGVPRPASSSVRQLTETVRGRSAQPSRSINRSTHSSNVQPRPIRANALHVHQPGTDKPGGAAKSVTRIVAPTVTNVRHRSPNPAVVGGPAADKANGIALVSGTRMNRRR